MGYTPGSANYNFVLQYTYALLHVFKSSNIALPQCWKKSFLGATMNKNLCLVGKYRLRISGCTGVTTEDYKDKTPKLDIRKYLNGL